MAAISADDMRSLERSAMSSGWTEESLMDLAGAQLGHAIAARFRVPGTAIAYLGKGHNAGDALVALRVLRDEFGWKTCLRSPYETVDWAALTHRKWEQLGADAPLAAPPDPAGANHSFLLLDGLLGIGGSGPLREPLLGLSREMKNLRERHGSRIAAIDLPSGVDPDTGRIHAGAVEADITFMIGCAKRGLLAATAVDSTGALALVPVAPLADPEVGEINLIAPQTCRFHKAPRPFDYHKGKAGKVGVLAGSIEFAGAAILAACGALRGGAGLVTLHVPPAASARIAANCPPELIVGTCEDPVSLLEPDYDAWVIGCGLGEMDAYFSERLLEFIEKSDIPAVLDADALNLIARRGRQAVFAKHHVLTPHPGEFKRLAPDLAALSREDAVTSFTNRTRATLLLKGSRTLVNRSGAGVWCNSTGGPGMATGGQGDILAGVIGSLLPHHEPLHAAALGAWICGRAAERALDEPKMSDESLLPTDVLMQLGGAFNDWRQSAR